MKKRVVSMILIAIVILQSNLLVLASNKYDSYSKKTKIGIDGLKSLVGTILEDGHGEVTMDDPFGKKGDIDPLAIPLNSNNMYVYECLYEFSDDISYSDFSEMVDSLETIYDLAQPYEFTDSDSNCTYYNYFDGDYYYTLSYNSNNNRVCFRTSTKESLKEKDNYFKKAINQSIDDHESDINPIDNAVQNSYDTVKNWLLNPSSLIVYDCYAMPSATDNLMMKKSKDDTLGSTYDRIDVCLYVGAQNKMGGISDSLYAFIYDLDGNLLEDMTYDDYKEDNSNLSHDMAALWLQYTYSMNLNDWRTWNKYEFDENGNWRKTAEPERNKNIVKYIENQDDFGTENDIEKIKVENSFQTDNPVVLELITQYYNATANKNLDKLQQLGEDIDESSKESILANPIESYNNIAIYFKDGLTQGEYNVYVYYEAKLPDIDQLVPSLGNMYLATREDGNLYVVDPNSHQEVADFLREAQTEEDVQELIANVNEKYQSVYLSNKELQEVIQKMRKDVS